MNANTLKFKKEQIEKFPRWIRNVAYFFSSRKALASLGFIVVSVLATIWFLVRVIPKPSRATYPCMQVAMPFMSGLVIWMLSVGGSFFAFRKARHLFSQTKHMAAFMLIVVSGVFCWITLSLPATNSKAAEAVKFEANKPLGTGRGIHPGRVAWAHNPNITSWNGKDGFYWEDRFNNQSASDKTVTASILTLTGETNENKAWNSLFTYFNKTKRNLKQGYSKNEKIAIKINQNNTLSQHDTAELNASPHMVLSLLKSLIEEGGVPEQNITVFDASRFITDNIFDKCHAVYPKVVFVDNCGGRGRVKAEYLDNAIPYSADNGKLATGLAKCAVDANYIINVALMKGHVGTGITLCAKNFYGVTSINYQWRKNAHDNFEADKKEGKPKYITFTDFLAHKDLGEKTLLFLIDSYYAHKECNFAPEFKWKMAPFNNNWPCSLFASQDGVAIDAVGLDFMFAEWPDMVDMKYCDHYLAEAALADNAPSGTKYDPERDGKACSSLGVFEHWNNGIEKRYTGNIKPGKGIELKYCKVD
jgi:hypothetical protein